MSTTEPDPTAADQEAEDRPPPDGERPVDDVEGRDRGIDAERDVEGGSPVDPDSGRPVPDPQSPGETLDTEDVAEPNEPA